MYAGRDGQVYRKGEGGDWQKYGGKGEGWSDVGRDQAQPRAESRGSLDRQAQSRDLGNQRAAQQRSPAVGAAGGYGGSYRGGGGARMGGGGRGGRR